MKLSIHKKELIDQLINQEDTTGSFTITVEDKGKKSFSISNEKGKVITLKGTYQLSNLLQELALMEEGKGYILLENITEQPVARLSRLIKNYYWEKLTRSLNTEDLLKSLNDEKMKGDILRIYVPKSDVESYQFYKDQTLNHNNIKVEKIPEQLSLEKINELNEKPGILALSYSKKEGKSIPFIVPGGRFNEMYGWDSYFIGIGLIIDDKFDLAQAMINNLEYQIIHYGKILNANRSYYLSRSQPPFFTSFIKEFYEKYSQKVPVDWLQQKLTTAISEYFNVWMTEGIRLTPNKLNRYFGEGKGMPEETESNHFDMVLSQYANKYNIPLSELKENLKKGKSVNKEIDQYFIHDRSMRESGHDTTNRLDNCSAHLNTVDLNSLLYKYETDIAFLIRHFFNNSFTFYDYNFIKQQQQNFISATNLYPLWANLCTKEQAEKIVNKHLPKLICKGGIVSTNNSMSIKENQLQRQWDSPYGWAPHQILIWQGLNNYNFTEKAQECIYRWLWLIVKTAVNYNGLIPEKFDVNKCTHKTDVEYGNVGTQFKYVPDGGFGWTNTSYKLGIELLNKNYINSLNNTTDPDLLFNR